jgi:dTDP-4-amino-4,6-dideoxygalactose transaminase
MPPLPEFNNYLNKIWDNKYLTNNGVFHQELEKELCKFLGVKYISLFANGTLALISALQALRITGEVITTPFTFVATTHSLWWNGIKPIFIDTEPDYFNLDPSKIEAAITPQTTAILPVHVYGNPCQVNNIQKIADNYGLKVIYDACHAFGVKINDNSVLNYGDLSVLSFHATKVFNTFEGGAIVCHDEKTKRRIDFLKNFGFADEVTVVAPGINAKMNEIQSAFGLLQLKYFDQNISKRRKIAEKYESCFINLQGIEFLKNHPSSQPNYSYFPVFINKFEYGRERDELYEHLKKQKVFARRYFFPLISRFPVYRELSSANPANLVVAEKIAKEVLCLPIYPDLEMDVVDEICEIICGYRSYK